MSPVGKAWGNACLARGKQEDCDGQPELSHASPYASSPRPAARSGVAARRSIPSWAAILNWQDAFSVFISTLRVMTT